MRKVEQTCDEFRSLGAYPMRMPVFCVLFWYVIVFVLFFQDRHAGHGFDSRAGRFYGI